MELVNQLFPLMSIHFHHSLSNAKRRRGFACKYGF